MPSPHEEPSHANDAHHRHPPPPSLTDGSHPGGSSLLVNDPPPRVSHPAIVPLVGDFAGSKALRSVSAFLKAHRASVTAFYLSNVEQYLFQDPDNWRKFYSNAATLPIDSSSLFIRSVFNGMTYNRDQSLGPYMRSQQMLAPIMDQLRAFSDGRLLQYLDVIQTSR